jgi:hypothetical protein
MATEDAMRRMVFDNAFEGVQLAAQRVDPERKLHTLVIASDLDKSLNGYDFVASSLDAKETIALLRFLIDRMEGGAFR